MVKTGEAQFFFFFFDALGQERGSDVLSLRGPLALQAGGPLDSEVVWSVILGPIPRASPKYYHDGLPLLCPPDGWSLPGGQLVAPQPLPPAKPLFLLLGEHREKCTGTTPSGTASSLPPLQANGLSLRRCKRRPAPGARGAPVGVACGGRGGRGASARHRRGRGRWARALAACAPAVPLPALRRAISWCALP